LYLPHTGWIFRGCPGWGGRAIRLFGRSAHALGDLANLSGLRLPIGGEGRQETVGFLLPRGFQCANAPRSSLAAILSFGLPYDCRLPAYCEGPAGVAGACAGNR